MDLKRFKEYFVVGSGIIILGLFFLVVFDLAFLGMGIFLSGLMLIFIGIHWARKPKTELPDERYIRINEKAGFNAFWTTLGILAVLTYVDAYFPLGQNFRESVTIVWFVGMISFIVHRFYYNRKGFK
jgi:voltage-gated potassium channel Kch